jgi:hypothetical protein
MVRCGGSSSLGGLDSTDNAAPDDGAASFCAARCSLKPSSVLALVFALLFALLFDGLAMNTPPPSVNLKR